MADVFPPEIEYEFVGHVARVFLFNIRKIQELEQNQYVEVSRIRLNSFSCSILAKKNYSENTKKTYLGLYIQLLIHDAENDEFRRLEKVPVRFLDWGELESSLGIPSHADMSNGVDIPTRWKNLILRYTILGLGKRTGGRVTKETVTRWMREQGTIQEFTSPEIIIDLSEVIPTEADMPLDMPQDIVERKPLNEIEVSIPRLVPRRNPFVDVLLPEDEIPKTDEPMEKDEKSKENVQVQELRVKTEHEKVEAIPRTKYEKVESKEQEHLQSEEAEVRPKPEQNPESNEKKEPYSEPKEKAENIESMEGGQTEASGAYQSKDSGKKSESEETHSEQEGVSVEPPNQPATVFPRVDRVESKNLTGREITASIRNRGPHVWMKFMFSLQNDSLEQDNPTIAGNNTSFFENGDIKGIDDYIELSLLEQSFSLIGYAIIRVVVSFYKKIPMPAEQPVPETPPLSTEKAENLLFQKIGPIGQPQPQAGGAVEQPRLGTSRSPSKRHPTLVKHLEESPPKRKK